MGIVPDADSEHENIFVRVFKRVFGPKRARDDAVDDNPDDDDNGGGADLGHRHKLPRVDPRRYPRRMDYVAVAEQARIDHEDATRPVAVRADQVPADAVDVHHVRRTAPNPNEALFMEQNMQIGVAAGQR